MPSLPIQDHVQVFRTLYLVHEPTSHARMNGPKAAKKYTKVHHAPDTPEIVEHLAGRRTIAAPLIGASGLMLHAALDIDAGGTVALQQLLAAAHVRGFVAYAITSDTDAHTGGHVWLHFDQPAAPERARQLADQLAAAAGVDAETYPTRKGLRLPFGVHQWTGKRGTLLLQDGQRFDLDTGTDAVAQALATIAALPKNQTSTLSDVPRRAPTASGARQTAPGSASDTITRYNGQTDLVALLESYGGKIAERYGNGGALLHCPCGRHSHGDRRASLEVQPARSARYGRMVAVGHAANCLFYTERRQVIDAFGVYCKLEGVTTREALYRLNPCRPARPPRHRNEPDPDEHNALPDDQTPETDVSHTAAQQQARVDDICALHAELRTRAKADITLGATAHRVLDALLIIANDRDWCRPSKPRLAAMLNVSNRTVQRGLVELEQRGYIRTDEHTTLDGTVYRGGYSTPLRHFLRETRTETTSSAVSPVSEDIRSLQALELEQACEAPPVSAGEEPAGASYNPAEDWTLRHDRPAPRRTWTSSLRPREVALWRWMREARSTWSDRAGDGANASAAVQHESTKDDQATSPAPETSVSRSFANPRLANPVQHAGPQVQPQPPSDPQRRKEYAKLLGKAKRVERSSPRQAAYLRARARQLEEVLISAPAPTVDELTREQADCPAMWRTPQARGLVPVQLTWGTG